MKAAEAIRRRLAALLLLAGMSLAAPAPAAGEPPAIPYPAVERLEPAVQRQLTGAREELEAILADEAASAGARARAYGELGRLYLLYHLRESALACFARASTLDPEGFRWAYYSGLLHQEGGEWEEAAAALGRALELEPGYAAARVRLGQVELERNRLEAAEEAFRKALDETGTRAAAHFGLGRIAAVRERWTEAAEHFQAGLAIQPEASSFRYPLAMAYRRQGDLERARQELELRGEGEMSFTDPLLATLEAQHQGLSRWLELAGRALLAERFDQAAGYFQNALEVDPESTAALSGLATARLRAGDAAGAGDAYRRLLALDPRDPAAQAGLGILLLHEGAVEEALEHLQAAITLAPDSPEVHVRLGVALDRAGRFDEAAGAFGRALELSPGDPAVLLRRGLALSRAGHPAEAVTAYRQALSLAPDAAPAWRGLAEALLATGRPAQARQVLEEGLAHQPQDGDLTHLLARLLATAPTADLRDGPRALELALAVFRAQPTIEHAETVAMALAETGRFDEATDWQRRALAEATRTGLERSSLEARLATYLRGEPCRTPWLARAPQPRGEQADGGSG